MSEMPETEAPVPAAEPKPQRRIWPLLAWGLIAAVIVAAGAVTALGPEGALIAGGCMAGAAVGGVILWRLPQLRKHFAGPRRAARMRTTQSRTRRWSLGGGSRKGMSRLGLGIGKGRAAKMPSAGRPKGSKLKGAVGRLGRAAGRLMPGRMRSGGRALAGKGRGVIGRLTGRRRGGAAGTGGGRRPGLVRRATARIMGAGRKRAAARAAAGKKPARSRPAAIGAAVALPAVAAARGIRKLLARKKKRKRSEDSDEQEPAAKPKPKPPDEPSTAVPARRPGQPRKPGSTYHPQHMRHPVAHQLEAAKEAIEQGVGGFEPENIDDLGHFLQTLPGVYEALASGLHRVADRFADELPLHPDVAEHLREMAAGAAGQQEYAGEAHQVFRAAHEDDLRRIEEPRPNERLWDVVENQ